MMAVAVPMGDPQLEFHWISDPGFLIQDFLIQCLHRMVNMMPSICFCPSPLPSEDCH